MRVRPWMAAAVGPIKASDGYMERVTARQACINFSIPELRTHSLGCDESSNRIVEKLSDSVSKTAAHRLKPRLAIASSHSEEAVHCIKCRMTRARVAELSRHRDALLVGRCLRAFVPSVSRHSKGEKRKDPTEMRSSSWWMKGFVSSLCASFLMTAATVALACSEHSATPCRGCQGT